MAFKRQPSPTFSTDVTVNIPNAKGGFDRNTFTAVFKRPAQEEMEATRKLTDKEICREYMVGWKLVDDDTKQEVPFNREELEALLLIDPTASATAVAFYQAYMGQKAKN